MNVIKKKILTGDFKQPVSKESNKAFPLPENLRRQMEWAFQEDFSDVSIHVGLAPLYLNTVAFTIGTQIYILPSAYNPESALGKEIIGHELAHILQQRWGKLTTDKIDNLICRDEVLEAEAAQSGKACAEGKRAFVSGKPLQTLVRTQQHAIQCYTVVPSADFEGQDIRVHNPQFHEGPMDFEEVVPDYSNDTFITQVKGGAGGLSNRSFLRNNVPNMIPNYKSIRPNDLELSLRISQNRRIAIQHVDLANEQSKVFYATNDIIVESNQRLELLGSKIRLTVTDPNQTITIGDNVLSRVMPQQLNDDGVVVDEGLQFSYSQNCDQVIGLVIGTPTGQLVPRGGVIPIDPAGWYEYTAARELLRQANIVNDVDNVPEELSFANLARTARAITVAYANTVRLNHNAEYISDLGINQYIKPEIGDGFCTASLIAQPVGDDGITPVEEVTEQRGPSTEDYMQDPMQVVDTRLCWGSHWAGIIAKDGDDVVTFENYARTREDNAVNPNDPRYYFQMYNTDPADVAQTWHGSWTNVPMMPYDAGLVGLQAIEDLRGYPAPEYMPSSLGARSFHNPISMRVSIRDNKYSEIARRLYREGGVNAIKNDHGMIEAAANADEEARHILKGLYYADKRLDKINRNGDEERDSRTERIQAWINAVDHARELNRHLQNEPLIRYTLQRLEELEAIRMRGCCTIL